MLLPLQKQTLQDVLGVDRFHVYAIPMLKINTGTEGVLSYLLDVSLLKNAAVFIGTGSSNLRSVVGCCCCEDLTFVLRACCLFVVVVVVVVVVGGVIVFGCRAYVHASCVRVRVKSYALHHAYCCCR